MEQILWAVKSAPVADVNEWAVLVAMAEAADQDGTNSFLSVTTISQRTRLAERTVQRRIGFLEDRGLLKRGDQTSARMIPADRRPVVYDLQVPYSFFRPEKTYDRSEAELSVNIWRAGRGRAPLTPEDRPDLVAAPEKNRRIDNGVPRPKKESPDPGSPDPVESDGVTTSHPAESDGVTTSPGRGDYESHRGVTTSHPTLPSNPPHDPPRSAARSAATANPVETSSSNDTFRNARGRDDAAAQESADHDHGDATRADNAPGAILDAMMLNPDEAARFRAWLVTATNATNPDGLIVTLHTSGRLPERLTQWRASDGTASAAPAAHGATTASTGAAQLRWCGRCDQDTRMATVTDHDGRELLRRCPTCNINAGRPAPGAGASQAIAQQVELAAANSTDAGREAFLAARAALPAGARRRVTTIGEPAPAAGR
jgi:hypothetical protein